MHTTIQYIIGLTILISNITFAGQSHNPTLAYLDDTALKQQLIDCENVFNISNKDGDSMNKDDMIYCGVISTEVRIRLFKDDWHKFLEWRKSRK